MTVKQVHMYECVCVLHMIFNIRNKRGGGGERERERERKRMIIGE